MIMKNNTGCARDRWSMVMSGSNYEHTHGHCHGESASSPEETLALLNYMLAHNRHHADELHELAHGVDDEAARDLIHEAVDALRESNLRLEEALALLQ